MSGIPRHLVVAAVELLEVGDFALARDVLLDALDGPSVMPPPCSVCGVRAWPGQVERHLYSAHHRDAEEVRRAA